MRFAFYASFCALLAAGGVSCSSGSFEVATTATDSGTMAVDMGMETTPPACPSTPGISTFCATIDVASMRPGYGGNTLGLDGKGVLYVFVYDKDPTPEVPSATPVVPIATIQYPDASMVGAEADVTKDFPRSLTGTVAKPGKYWVVAVFEDSKDAAARSTALSNIVAGDFALLPKVNGKKQDYPQLDMQAGVSVTTSVVLQPIRQISASMAVAFTKTDDKTNLTIHGDGPLVMALYDQSVSSVLTATPTSVAILPSCTYVQPRSVTGGNKPTTVSFTTAVTGQQKILAALLDYPSPAGDSTFPPRGSLLSDLTNPPTVNIDAASWSVAASINFVVASSPYSVPAPGPPEQPASEYVCAPPSGG